MLTIIQRYAASLPRADALTARRIQGAAEVAGRALSAVEMELVKCGYATIDMEGNTGRSTK